PVRSRPPSPPPAGPAPTPTPTPGSAKSSPTPETADDTAHGAGRRPLLEHLLRRHLPFRAGHRTHPRPAVPDPTRTLLDRSGSRFGEPAVGHGLGHRPSNRGRRRPRPAHHLDRVRPRRPTPQCPPGRPGPAGPRS